MNAAARRARFREVLAEPRCVHPASVFDPLSVRIAADLGFEIGMFAGSVAAMTVLGAPDLTLITLSELAAQALRIGRACDLPLLVDADHGYGNALNVRRTVEELAIAGVAALTIEDTQLPLPFGNTGRMTLISVAEGIGKLRAALSARQDDALVVVGRTGAMATAGVTETIARARAYAATGVDALFFTGITTRAQLDAVAAEIALPIILGGINAELDDDAYLAARGVRIALQGHLPFLVALRGVYETLAALRDGVKPAQIVGASAELLLGTTRDADYRRWLAAFARDG